MLRGFASSLCFVQVAVCGAVGDVSLLPGATASSMVQKRSHLQTNFDQKVEGGASLGRALAFVQYLAAKAHNYTMTQEETGAMGVIEDFINRLFTDIVTQHNEDQGEVDRARDLIQNCTNQAESHMDTSLGFKNTTGASRTDHENCRLAAHDQAGHASTACSAYDTYRKLSNAVPPPCIPTDLTSSSISSDDPTEKDDMEFCLNRTWVWIEALYKKFDACRTSTNNHTNQTRGCHRKQLTFEQAFCHYTESLNHTCDTQDECRSSVIPNRNDSHAGVKVSEAARKVDYETGKRVLCYLSVFDEKNNSKKPAVFEGCKRLTVNVSDYNVTYWEIPGPTTCQKEPAEPCANSWEQVEYFNKSWYSTSETDKCNPCTATTTTTTTPPPARVGDTHSLIHAQYNGLIVKPNGDVWATGSNYCGESTGDGNNVNLDSWQKFPISGVVEAVTGNCWSGFLREDGTVTIVGQLGGVLTRYPAQIPGVSDVRKLVSGSNTLFMITNSGDVWACGNNQNGQLGDGTQTSRNWNVPIKVDLQNVRQVAAHEYSTLFLMEDGKLWGIGKNSNNMLGLESNNNADTFQEAMKGHSDIVQICKSYMSDFGIFLKANGEVWGFGTNQNHQFGKVNGKYQGDFTTPKKLSWTATEIFCGRVTTFHFKQDNGDLYSLGNNGYNNAGNPSAHWIDEPYLVKSGMSQVWDGYEDALYLAVDGAVWGAGLNRYMVLGLGHANRVQTLTEVFDRNA